MVITFYNYDGHQDTINKVLGEGVDIDGTLRPDFNVLRPTIVVRLPGRPTYNYCYIEAFGRYYFVDSISFIGNNGHEIRLYVDVLKTYEAQILEAAADITESDDPNKYVSTRNTVYDRQPNFEKVEFPNKGLLNEEGSIIMVTIKGNI